MFLADQGVLPAEDPTRYVAYFIIHFMLLYACFVVVLNVVLALRWRARFEMNIL